MLKTPIMNKIKLKDIKLALSINELQTLPSGKIMINTINAYSYNIAKKNKLFEEALIKSDILLPDGVSIVMACKWLKAKYQPKKRITGWDLFTFEMKRLNEKGGKCLFMGSNEKVLELIKKRAKNEYPNIILETYSPPFKDNFNEEENNMMINTINQVNPDLLWIGMTAPKQESWLYSNWNKLNIHCHTGTIGAVFDFYAGTISRAPISWQNHSLEWLFRLLKEPHRMWKRYIIGNPLFIYNIIKEKFS